MNFINKKNKCKITNNKGGALLFVIIACLVIILVESTLYLLITKDKSTNTDLLNSVKAFYLADAGANYILYAKKVSLSPDYNLQNLDFGGEFAGTFQVTNLGGDKYSSEGKTWNTQSFAKVSPAPPDVHYTAKRKVYFEIDPGKNVITNWYEER
ncbi:MAG: hypothetical protein ABIH00_10880 [Armatimonadota bacterium]